MQPWYSYTTMNTSEVSVYNRETGKMETYPVIKWVLDREGNRVAIYNPNSGAVTQ